MLQSGFLKWAKCARRQFELHPRRTLAFEQPCFHYSAGNRKVAGGRNGRAESGGAGWSHWCCIALVLIIIG